MLEEMTKDDRRYCVSTKEKWQYNYRAKTNLAHEYKQHFHYSVEINNIEASQMCQLTMKWFRVNRQSS